LLELNELSALKWIKLPDYDSRVGKMKRLEAEHTMFRGMYGLGIDPGRNYGAAVIKDGHLLVWWGKMEKRAELYMYGTTAYTIARAYLCEQHMGETPAVVEGAAYRAGYGQVGLAEVRFGFYLGLLHAGMDAVIVPPASVRKQAFGSAKVTGFELWPTLNHNAADAVGCALASAYLT